MTDSNRRWKQRNKDKVKQAAKKYRDTYKDRIRDTQFKSKYGISLSDYNDLLISQDYKCAICNQEETVMSRTRLETLRLAVDHCHNTGKVRGLLCQSCNSALGKFKDNVTILEKAICYLKENHGC